jgi:hypothetical protein
MDEPEAAFGPQSVEDPSMLVGDLSGRESESVEDQDQDPSGSTKAPQRWRTRRSHYVTPPPVPRTKDAPWTIRRVGNR